MTSRMNSRMVPHQLQHRAPFVDQTTSIVYDVNEPDFEGWLTKQSMWLKDWRRRYFLLKGSKLFFCKTPFSSPHGMIDLSLCTTVKSADLKSKKRFSFEISTPDITYLLYADGEKEKDDWIGNVGRAIVRCSSTFQGGKSGFHPGGTTTDTGDNTYGYNNNNDYDDDDDYSNSSNNPYFN